MSDNLPGEGLFGWLGRQVGHVKKAVKTKPKALPAAKRSAQQSAGQRPPQPAAPDAPADPATPAVVYRHNEVQEAEHPTQPGVKLRRTIIDEVVVDERERPSDQS